MAKDIEFIKGETYSFSTNKGNKYTIQCCYPKENSENILEEVYNGLNYLGMFDHLNNNL